VRLLFVCTGNVCRSPLAEHLARAFLDDAFGVSGAAVGVGSAGTHAVVGCEMEPSSAAVLRGLGGNPAGFRARQLAAEMVEGADLTLTMTRRHRRDVLKLAPRAMFRTYTLREAADLLGHISPNLLPPVTTPADRLRALVAALGKQRATRRRADSDTDDVRDPMGSRADVHQAVGDQIFGALVPLLQALCGTPQVGGVSRALPSGADQPSTDAQTTRITRYRPPAGRYGSSTPAR
jgi:protein-tyrosine-phosphatase